MNHRLKLEHVREARRLINPVFLDSPQFVSESLSDALGVRLVVKVETANPIRCFKGRGAEYFAARFLEGKATRAAPDAPLALITASAGNLGQAMAYACRSRGIPLTVFAATTANPFKIERMRALGAEVVLFGKDFDDAKLEAKRVATEKGIHMVEDSLDPETGEGAGTIGLELARFPESFNAVLLNFGNGALACGIGLVLKDESPRARIVAVQAAGAPAMIQSWQRGEIVRYPSAATIADGIGIRLPIAECVEDMRGVIDEGLLVQEETLHEAMRLAHRHLGLVVEPSGVVGLAALIEHRTAFSGQTVAVVLSGGNLTPEQVKRWLA
jgi:threonine dehydratase